MIAAAFWASLLLAQVAFYQFGMPLLLKDQSDQATVRTILRVSSFIFTSCNALAVLMIALGIRSKRSAPDQPTILPDTSEVVDAQMIK